MIRICLVEDQTLVRQGIHSLLGLVDDIRVVAEARDGQEALQIIPQARPDVVLLDMRLPKLSGLEVLKRLKQANCLPPTLILTTFDDDEVVLEGIRIGAKGFLLKDVSLDQLTSAIRALASGGTLIQPAVTERLLKGFGEVKCDFPSLQPPDRLTERETEVLRLMAGGYSNREIAKALSVTEGTVKNHVSNILSKIGVRDRYPCSPQGLGARLPLVFSGAQELMKLTPGILSVLFFLSSSGLPSNLYLSTTDHHSRVAPLVRHAWLRPCRLPNLKEEVLCGSYEVFEDRAARSGRKIALNIIVLRALSTRPTPDPVFYLVGGPGQGAASLAGKVAARALQKIRRERDIIFVDQRGTGGSNPLNCNLYGDTDDIRGYFGELFPVDKVRECRNDLEKRANLTLYTTPIAMDDLNEIREALGYKHINLYGGSYGTFAALVYLRQHSKHVRSVVLAGVKTPDFNLPLPFAKGAQYAMDRLFRACEADPLCRTAFPNLPIEFAALLARLEKGAVSFELTNPITEKPQQVSMSRGVFAERLRLLLYDPTFARLVPLLIHRAYQNDFVPFATVSLLRSRPITDQIAMGMYFSVTCAEDIPFITEGEIARETAGTFLGDYRVRVHIKACEEWPKGKISPGYKNAVRSNVPVLMISGELDPASPWWFAKAAVRHLPNSRQVIVPYASHLNNLECLDTLIAEFVSKGSPHGLDTSCVDGIRLPVPFATELPSELRRDR